MVMSTSLKRWILMEPSLSKKRLFDSPLWILILSLKSKNNEVLLWNFGRFTYYWSFYVSVASNYVNTCLIGEFILPQKTVCKPSSKPTFIFKAQVQPTQRSELKIRMA